MMLKIDYTHSNVFWALSDFRCTLRVLGIGDMDFQKYGSSVYLLETYF